MFHCHIQLAHCVSGPMSRWWTHLLCKAAIPPLGPVWSRAVFGWTDGSLSVLWALDVSMAAGSEVNPIAGGQTFVVMSSVL